LAIDARPDCESDPQILVKLFRALAKKSSVKLVGENVKQINESNVVEQIKEDGNGYDEVWIFRADINKFGLINGDQIKSIANHIFTDSIP